MSDNTELEFDEKRAIELTNIARTAVKNDPIAMFTSDADCLIYEHFFIKGMEHASQIVNDLLKIIDNSRCYLTDSQLETIKKARVH